MYKQHADDCGDEELVTWQEPARRLNIQKRAFWETVHREGIPYYRVNARVIRFRMSEFELWLRSKRIGGAS